MCFLFFFSSLKFLFNNQRHVCFSFPPFLPRSRSLTQAERVGAKRLPFFFARNYTMYCYARFVNQTQQHLRCAPLPSFGLKNKKGGKAGALKGMEGTLPGHAKPLFLFSSFFPRKNKASYPSTRSIVVIDVFLVFVHCDCLNTYPFVQLRAFTLHFISACLQGFTVYVCVQCYT